MVPIPEPNGSQLSSIYITTGFITSSMHMQPGQRMQEAEDLLESWIQNAVKEAQEEVFVEDPRLEREDMRKINKVNDALKQQGEEGLWGSVHYRIYTEEDDDGDEVVSIDTFGVPMIPSDVEGVDIDESDRRTYNDILSDYGVKVSQKVEKQFEDWQSDRREQA